MASHIHWAGMVVDDDALLQVDGFEHLRHKVAVYFQLLEAVGDKPVVSTEM